MSYFRLLQVLALLLLVGPLAACADNNNKPVYAKDMSATNIPNQTNVIKLEVFAPVDDVYKDDAKNDVASHIDAKPSASDKEVLELLKAGVKKAFAAAGKNVTEDAAQNHTMTLRAYTYYRPDSGLMVKRSMVVYLHFYDTDGKEVFRIYNLYKQNDSLLGGLISSAINSRDSTITRVADDIVRVVLEELKKGTKTVPAVVSSSTTPTS